jgi:proteasome lid subunit RPN8/RPN11
MALELTSGQLDSIRAHGGREYPNECCGVMLGRADGAVKRVEEIVPLSNLRHDPKRAQELLPLAEPGRESERNRFLIDPLEQLKVEKGARARGLDVIGYYHSHPDHRAVPSEYDREHAWPVYSYVIVSVERGEATALTSWVLAEDRARFIQEEILKPQATV